MLRSLTVLSIMVPLKKEVVMKSIEIDDDLYAFIASQTKHIGESASQILRRLLLPEDGAASNVNTAESATTIQTKSTAAEKVSAAPESGLAQESNKAVESASIDETAAKQPIGTNSNAATEVKATKPALKSTAKTTAKKPIAKKPSTARATATNKKAATATNDVQTTEQHDKRDILDTVSKDALGTFTKRVDQFLFVLSAAHKLNADSFSNVESIKGKNRTYFATTKAALLENGSSTNPKAIPDSPYWVVTNNNTAKKTNMLEQVLRNLGYRPDVVETVVARFSSEGK